MFLFTSSLFFFKDNELLSLYPIPMYVVFFHWFNILFT